MDDELDLARIGQQLGQTGYDLFRRIVRRAEDFSGKGAARLLIVDDKIGERATDIDRYAKPAHASRLTPIPLPSETRVGLER